MVGGLIVFAVTGLALCICSFIAFVRPPRCIKCRIPLQPVAETVRELGPYGVETVIHYECTDCYRALDRKLMHVFIG